MEQTINYDQFTSITSNREIHAGHVRKLIKSIGKKNLLHLHPILCNEQLEIIDGQHRLEAAKQMGVPIYFVKDDCVSKSDIASINSNSKNWNVLDYINYYTIEKRPGFDKLSAFLSEYPEIKPTTAVSLLSCDQTRNSKALQEGVVDASNYAVAVDVAEVLKYFRNHFESAYEGKFIMAVYDLMMHPEYKFEILKDKVELQPRSLVRCISKKQYLEMLLEIYNYKSSKNRISCI